MARAASKNGDGPIIIKNMPTVGYITPSRQNILRWIFLPN